MNSTVLEKKIKKRLDILDKLRFVPLSRISFSGCIGRDDGLDTPIPLSLEEGSVWGGGRKDFQLAARSRFPDAAAQPAVLVLKLGETHVTDDLNFLYGPEAVVAVDGECISGADPNHSLIFIPEKYMDGAEHEISLDGWTGIADELYQAGFLGFARERYCVSDFYTAARICMDTAMSTADETLRARLMLLLSEAMDKLSLTSCNDNEFELGVRQAQTYLNEGLAKMPDGALCRVTACGHGHLDLAWLWRTKTTRKKTARTFLNVLRLMERYDDFCYSQTQAQAYSWMEQDYPNIFAQVKKRIEEGRWELLGGMWVESDCNITGAESLVRQFLLYDSYVRERFNTKGTRAVWLPDTFGFCAQLPQLMKSAGIDYFATAKLTWNQYNKMPSESFIWRGLDGSELLSHIVSVTKPDWFGGTYSADLTPQELLTTVNRAENRAASKDMLLAYGMGDGGGGPTEMMLRRAEVLKGAYPGLPKLELGTFKGFFEKLSQQSKLPTWEGELYLELHRGTYTSQSEIKRRNRECEAALGMAEFISAWASLGGKHLYPHEKLRKCWETVCLNQFHDILPGSSIHQVYEDAAQELDEVLRCCRRLSEEAVRSMEPLLEKGSAFLAVNPGSFEQSALLKLPFPVAQDELVFSGEKLLPQFEADGARYVLTEGIKGFGLSAFKLAGADGNCAVICPERIGSMAGYVMENEKLRVEFDENGEICSWRDLENRRELIAQGARAGRWQLFEDVPGSWDAWDIDEYYSEKGYESARLLEAINYDCGFMQGLYMKKTIGSSVIEQYVSLLPDSGRIDMRCRVDYKERRRLLRFESSVDIHAATAEYATQFGAVSRPTTANTGWERAKFECCMQGWVDLCEGDYGVGLACDNRYGISVKGGSISLAVQKSASFPDEQADAGVHEFSLSLVPHKREDKAKLLAASCALKKPIGIFELEKPAGELRSAALVAADSDALIIESVKKAEREKALVVRLYEGYNTRGRSTVLSAIPFTRVESADILENPREKLESDGQVFGIEYRPYEIKTIILKA